MNPTNYHVTLKENITAQMQEVIDFAIKGKESELEEYLEAREANTPKKKMEHTADFITQITPNFGENLPYVNDEFGCAFHGENYQYNMPPFAVTNMHYAINKDWGNGKIKSPGNGKNRNAWSKELQQAVIDKRNSVQEDSEARAVFKYWCEKANKNDIFYRCRKFILNENSTEGIHLPYTEQPKAIFTPYSETNKKPQAASHKPQAASHKPSPQPATRNPKPETSYTKRVIYEAA